jgi:HK97 family phage portal protein
MIGFLKSTARRVLNALPSGHSGWVSLGSIGDAWASVGRRSHAGKTVSGNTTMEVSAAWDCVRKTAEVISTLPLAMYERQDDGAKVRISDQMQEILSLSPNSEQTGVEFWEGMVAHMVLRGNACAEKQRIGNRVVGLKPLPGMQPSRNQDGKLAYDFIDRGKRERLPAEKVFHLRGFGTGDGLGLSAIKYGAHSIGAALAADEAAGKVFANAMMPSGAIETDHTLTPEQRQALKVYLRDFGGSSKVGKILTLEGGLKYNQLQMNPEDAQLLETRRFNVEDVCRWFGVPPIIIGHASQGQTMWGSGVEAIMLSWLTLGINPLLTRIERRIQKDLIPTARRRWFFEFNREAMLQMDSKAKAEFLLKMRFGGFMTGNEGRDKLNLPRRDDADDLLVQTSLTPADVLGKETA